MRQEDFIFNELEKLGYDTEMLLATFGYNFLVNLYFIEKMKK